MRSFSILSLLLLVGCQSLPPFPEGEVGALDLEFDRVVVYQAPSDLNGKFVKKRDDPIPQWNNAICAPWEYYLEVRDWGKDVYRYVEQQCKCQ